MVFLIEIGTEIGVRRISHHHLRGIVDEQVCTMYREVWHVFVDRMIDEHLTFLPFVGFEAHAYRNGKLLLPREDVLILRP